MTFTSHGRLLIAAAAATFAAITISGINRIAGGDASPWLAALLLVAVAAALSLAAAAAAIVWRRRDASPWLRAVTLAAPCLLLAWQIADRALAAAGLAAPGIVASLALSTAALGSQIAAVGILALPLSGPARLGARAAAQARRYRTMALLAVIGAWLMLLTGSAVTAGGSAQIAAAVHLAHRAAAMAVGVLLGLLLWETWRTRRGDRALMGLVTLGLGLLAAQSLVGAADLALNLPALLSGLHQLLATELWAVAVALGVVALRRPAPEEAPVRGVAPTAPNARRPSLIADYISLTKPRVISLLLVTTLTAMFITGQGAPSLWLVVWTMIGGYLAAGGAGAINCAFDSDIDTNMGRTSRRPVPSGRIPAEHALWFGIALCVLAFVVLASFTTLLAAVLAMVGAVYYALVYTRWLKRSTWQNIVIGGGAGAIPPLVGWTAVTGTLSLPAVLLFVIVFYWTPPHFWALALVKQKDYARAGVPMLPVVAGEHETRWQILLYSLLMVAISLLLTPLQAMGAIYLALALALGVIFLYYAWQVWRTGEQAHIWGLYKYSLLYLALLFAAMVLDRTIAIG